MTQPPQPRENVVRDVPVRRVGPGDPRHTVIVEGVVDLLLNGRVLVRLGCLPAALEDLAAGFLASEGLVAAPAAISQIQVSADRRKVEVRAQVDPDLLVGFRERVATSSGCGGGASGTATAVPRCADDARFAPDEISARMKEFDRRSALFAETGGVHAAALSDGRSLLAFAEDLGRHNAVDKCIGHCWRQGGTLGRLALLSTGRLSGDILAKAARVGLPVVVSRGAVTSRAIEIAQAADITAVGFARGQRMNVYTAAWRLGLAEPGAP